MGFAAAASLEGFPYRGSRYRGFATETLSRRKVNAGATPGGRGRGLLTDGIHTTLEEQVAMSLHVIGHNQRFRVIHNTFRRSTEIISRYFQQVLYAIGDLRGEMIKPTSMNTPTKIKNSYRWFPYFRDCIGTIDGTHVTAKVPRSMSAAFRGRKHYTSQNVLAAVDFDMRFTYVLAGWEGSTHDASILADSLSRPDGLQIPDASNAMDRGNKGKTDLFNFIPHPPSRMDACAYLEEPIIMTFGEFRFGVNKEGSYRLEVPISSEFSAVDSNFSSSDEEFSSPYFIDNKASGKLAKIFSNTSFESSADSFISSDSDSVDSFNFIDKSVAIGKIRLKEEDEAKTAFITPYGVFCYKTMPFGLKNAGATYQRMMQKCLATQIGKNVQVYIDDVVITSKKGSTLIEDLKETFDNLDKFCLKLNPTKCSLEFPLENFSGS
ncbi:hypothetical protein QYE76_020830 [Lolium multiflorum]|uniref:Uncharacterized protein n=1 Tax=Lolium multiflorum TaxID=4521 RepID=A0AAD8R9M5_LOLMU|nr:hypothetical protein QYE76_020830 [Lolium multiflorum]